MKRLLSLLTVVLLGLTASRSEAQYGVANTSTLVTLAPGGTATIGFVVRSPIPNPNYAPTIMVRAVGPTLASFGISNPVASPQLRMVTSTGAAGIEIFYLAPIDWTATFASAGAFPLPGNEENSGAVRFYTTPPGAYSVQVSDASGKGGSVLLEVYMSVLIGTNPGGPT